MTILVWDGASLAADRQSAVGDMSVEVEKIIRLDDGRLLGLCGSESLVHAMVDSVLHGAAWPVAVGDEGATLVIVSPTGEVSYYTSHRATAVKLKQRWFAWGCGREFAAGAIAMGADAKRAAEVACELCHYCGMGVQVEKPGPAQ